MGVPGLHSWLKRRYPEAFVPMPADFRADHLHIDLSSTLHQVIRRGAAACMQQSWHGGGGGGGSGGMRGGRARAPRHHWCA